MAMDKRTEISYHDTHRIGNLFPLYRTYFAEAEI